MDSVTEICRGWVEFQDWGFKDICDENVPDGHYLGSKYTIGQLKKHAETNYLDGFTISQKSEAVYFKKCGLQKKEFYESEALVDALSKAYGISTFLNIDVPC